MACVKDCPCSNTACPRHGKCCECVKAHKEKGNLPSCLRQVQEEQK